MIHKAKDLSPDQKLTVENLLGRRVLDDETISIRAVHSHPISEQRRADIAKQLREYFAEVDAHRQQASAEEADEIITEAIKTSRLGYRSRQ